MCGEKASGRVAKQDPRKVCIYICCGQPSAETGSGVGEKTACCVPVVVQCSPGSAEGCCDVTRFCCGGGETDE